jgi:hypothetical protein
VRENDGRRLDHHILEQMRLRAVDAIESGMHPEDVAASLGMARGTVYERLARYREGGKDALRALPVPGRPPKLNVEHLQKPSNLDRQDRRRLLSIPGLPAWSGDYRSLIQQFLRSAFRVVRRCGPICDSGTETWHTCARQVFIWLTIARSAGASSGLRPRDDAFDQRSVVSCLPGL